MKRKLPKELEPAIENIKNDPIRPADRRIHQTRKYRLITPLCGGGIAARENDPGKLIRETSVRGQLRFWWRAMCAKGSLHDIYEREAAIFGASAGEKEDPDTKKKTKFGCSAVAIRITVNKSGTAEPVYTREEKNRVKPADRWKSIAYAAFPLQPSNEEARNLRASQFHCVTSDIEFTLEISYPKEFKDDIEDALWAWETFGGVGGRTRRGFGALQLLEVDGQKQEPPKSSDLLTAIRNLLPDERQVPKGVPHLDENCKFKIIFAGDALKAWGNAIEKYRQFRQYRRKGSKPNRPGLSYWPEPDEIRRIFIANGRGRPAHHPANRVCKFPRANFGLPIIFHFNNNEGPLREFQINLEGKERLASPLIIRPIETDTGPVAIALLLRSPTAAELKQSGMGIVASGHGIQQPIDVSLTATEANLLTTDGLNVLNRKADVLEAFLDYFEAEGTGIQGQHRNYRR